MKRLAFLLALLMGSCACADTEFFEVKHTSGLTIYFRFFDTSLGAGANVYTFDFDDDAWETSLGACADPKLAATEKTDMGDGDESVYTASYNLATIYSTATAKRFVVQAVDDLATDEVISEGELWIAAGVRVEPAQMMNVAHTGTSLTIVNNAGSAITATSSGGNGHGMVLTGNGIGEGLQASLLRIAGLSEFGGIQVTAAAGTGHAVHLQGGAAAGNALRALAPTASAIYLGSTGPGAAVAGLQIVGRGTEPGAIITGGVTGHGLHLRGGSTSGDGLHTEAQTLGDGIEAVGAGGGYDINADIQGNLSGSVGSLTGHTVQTGDSFARLGAPAGASVSADIAAVKVDTAATLTDTGTTLPATLTVMDGKLDTIDTVADAILVDTGTTLPATLTGMSGAGFLTAMDSLEAIRNRGDAAWVTGGPGTGDWTAAEATQIRRALGITGATANTTGTGLIDDIIKLIQGGP